MDIDTNELEAKAGIPLDAAMTHAEMMRAFEAFKKMKLTATPSPSSDQSRA